MSEIRVALGERSYPAIVEHGVSRSLTEVLVKVAPSKRYFLITDENIRSLYPDIFATGDSLFRTLVLPSGEGFKNIETLNSIWAFLLQHEVERNHVLAAVGGGVIGDLAGFAAATILRGIRLVQIPTTLLAQVDASIGGKTGINHPLGKNLVGAFHQPTAVLIDPTFLATLPPPEFQSGMYEVIKYSLIERNGLYDKLAGVRWNRADDMTAIIESCVRCKAAVVASDEQERGRRMILNFGHTLGHAIETATGFQAFTHGQAVGWGMLFAASLAEATGICNQATGDAIRRLVLQNGKLPALTCSGASLMDAMRRDKKVRERRFTFILPTDIGEVVIQPGISEEVVQSRLGEFLS